MPSKKASKKSSKLDNIYAEVVEEQQTGVQRPQGSIFSGDKKSSRRHRRKQQAAGKQRNDRAVQPKINAPFQAAEGSAPREVLLERKRREFKNVNLLDLLKERQVDLVAGTFEGKPVSNDLPLETFDNTEFERFSNLADWLSLDSSSSQPVPAKAFNRENASFEPVQVLEYDDTSGKFTVEWESSGAKHQLSRLDVCFSAEDPVQFADRVAAAYAGRRRTMDTIRYNLYVDCMPTDDIPALDSDQLNRVLGLAFRTKQLGGKEALDTRSLISEVNLDYSRTMNKIIFDMNSQDGVFPELPTVQPEQALPPATGTVPLELAELDVNVDSPPDYASLLKNFSFQTLMGRPETCAVIEKVSDSCSGLLDVGLFNIDISKPQRISDFVSQQGGSLKDAIGYLNDKWCATIKKHFENELGTVTKGWFKLDETNRDMYNMSKLKNLFALANFKMEDTLRTMVEKSVEDYGALVLGRRKENPLFVVDLSVNAEKGLIELSSEPKEFLSAFLDTFNEGLESVKGIVQVERRVMNRLFWSDTPVLASVETSEPLPARVVEQVSEYVSDCCQPVLDYAKTFEKYHDIVKIDVEQMAADLITKFTQDDEHASLDYLGLLGQIRKLVTHHRDLAKKVTEEIPSSMPINLFVVNCKKVQQQLVDKHNKIADHMLNMFASRVGEAALSFTQKYETIERKLHKPVTNIEQLSDMEEYMKDVPKLLEEQATGSEQMLREFDILEGFGYYLPKRDFVARWNLFGFPKKICDRISQLEEENAEKRVSYLNDMKTDQQLFEENLASLASEVSRLERFNDPAKVVQVSQYVKEIKEKIEAYKAESAVFNSREALFDADVTEYGQISQIQREFEPFEFLWSTAASWAKNHEAWMHGKFTDIDAESLEKDVNEYYRKLVKCEKSFSKKGQHGCADIAKKLKTEVDAFRPYGPVVVALRNPGMRDRHWKDLSVKINKVIQPDDSFSLQTIIDMGLVEQSETCEKIGEQAAKEYQIELALNKMVEEWKEMMLEIVPYKETGTSVLRGADELMALLDEHITMTQAMSFSSFKKPFEERIADWDKTLSCVSEVIEEWLAVQRSWLYLQPIFDSDDIQKQLPTEAKRFITVDRNWRSTLAAAEKAPLAIKFCNSSKLYEKFQESNKFLDLVQKGLSDYLETKRAAFSRFYFLSNDELLEILSETKDPKKVQPHLKKCFEAMQRVTFDEDLQITEMHSREKEIIQFIEPINPVSRNVEDWMTDLEKGMKASVKSQVYKAIIDYTVTKRTKWMQVWPGMCVINCSMNHWTRMMEDQMAAKGAEGVKEALELQKSQLADMVVLVRGYLPKLARNSIGALTVMDVHARDVTLNLVELGVSDKGAFEWISQMRFYWMVAPGQSVLDSKFAKEQDGSLADITEEGDLYGIMVTSIRRYAYEYLGNSFRLVITPLTDKCYLTLMGALEQILGGAPAGPAGTGKTETTKDLAKALAKQCVVFNCSDGMDYKMTGKFFKGLASCGAWCCFDEFNRIHIEVLSVIAQQIMTLQEGVFQRKDRIIFEDTDIALDGAFAVFITMNPGYAGRTELPDNLKALFRPVAMMVPDYALIGEIMLFAYGYGDSRSCAKKMVATFRLCSEQLSSQDHYDYGMRAVKTVIVAAGNLKRADPDCDEEELMLRGLIDVNLPKFLSHDLPLFKGIMGDLFPGKTKPQVNYGSLDASIRYITAKKGLQPVPWFIDKVIQLYEMIVVRHGLMVVGPTGGGKSNNIYVLADALSLLKKQGIKGERYETVHVKYINPKSITMGQLYGSFDPSTHEWQDGVLANLIRVCVKQDDDDLKWMLFDGPVDTLWIESMNTVLDDNKKLCLNSGEIVALSAPMTMMFEPADLSVASPATVSRCGMIYMEPTALGLDCAMFSWLTQLPAGFTKAHKARLRQLVDTYLDPTLFFLRRSCTEPVPTVNNNLAASLRRMMDCQFQQYKRGEGEDKLSKDEIAALGESLEGFFMFAFVWSVCCTVDKFGRKALDEFVRRECASNGFRYPFPEKNTIYDYVWDGSSNKWVEWSETVEPYQHNPKLSFSELIIPTTDTIKYTHIMNMLIERSMHVLVCGPTGTGKSVNINTYLQKMDKKFVPIAFTFSAQTSENMTQDIIDGKCEKRRKGVFGPMAGKKFVVFVDDVNMPQREIFGAQPPIELLRQLLCASGWYDRKTLKWRSIIDTIVINACGPPGGGRNPVTPRYFRHFNVLCYTAMSAQVMSQIFTTILDGHLAQCEDEVAGLTDFLTRGCINLYDSILNALLPTPSRPHYTFNLRDLGKIFQGMLMTDVKKLNTSADVMRLWLHECQRIFRDRLINDADRGWFDDFMRNKFKENNMELDEIVADPEFLLYGDYMIPGADPRIYAKVDGAKIIPTVEEYLNDYNAESKTPMLLVMFKDAIRHVSRIARVIRQPLGNALLLGIGGSGRQSLTRLATFMAEYECFQVEIAKGYGQAQWREDLRTCLLKAGLDNKQVVFLFNDTQIVFESMLEDVNNILNSGDVPNLYGPEEMDQIINTCRIDCQKKRIPPTKLNIFGQYIQRVRNNMHVVICMSPIGEAFRTRLRMFPSLVNCCTIDWFSEWPDEALKSVADSSMRSEDMKLGDNFDGVVEMFKNIHQSVAEASKRYLAMLDRNNYVTPTSYLELLDTYKKVIKLKRGEVGGLQTKLQNGLDKISFAEESVATLKEQIIEMAPVLKKTSEEVSAMIVQIDKDKVDAGKTKAVVEEIEAQANIEAAEAKAIADDAQRDLDEALPALDEAVACLALLKKSDIVEVGSMKTPPSGVKLTMEVACLMFDVRPVIEKDPVNMGQKVKNYWAAAKKNILNNPKKFLDDLVAFDKDNIADNKAEKLGVYCQNPDFTPAAVSKASKACTAVCMWARAMYKYHTVAKEVEPKKAALKQATDMLAVTMATLADAKTKLDAVNERLSMLEANFNKSNAEKEELAAKMKQCTDRLARADILINGLADEKERWAVTVKTLSKTYDNLIGDVLVASGTIAYLGAFTPSFRQDIVKDILANIKRLNVSHSDEASIMSVLADPVQLRSWNIVGLPTDNHSLENGIIMSTARRWPLCIDPQGQANRFIKNFAKETSSNGFEVIKLTEPNFLRTLENGVRFGRWIILENIMEELDAALEPLLLQQKFRQGGTEMIKVGDSVIPWNDQFRFFMTTKLPNPHYPPEVCVKVSLLNFTITIGGLEDQLLGVTIREERPDLEEQKNGLVVSNAKMAKQLKDLEDMILQLLSNSKGNILDDFELIEALGQSKKKAKEIDEKMAEAAIAEKEIDSVREEYRPCAFRGSLLYFCIADLAKIDPMYQYSLEWFTRLYAKGCQDSEQNADLAIRKTNLIDFFTFSLYKNICRSLFEKHKLLFSFMMCIKIQQGNDEIDPLEWRFLISGMTPDKMTVTNPDPSWIVERAWGEITALSTLPAFTGFADTFDTVAWKKFYDSDVPQEEKYPGKWDSLSSFRKMCLLRTVRPDKVMPAVLSYVVESMGKRFVEPPPFDVNGSYEDSSCTSPLVFVLTSGSDPTKMVYAFAEEMRCKVGGLSLGQGQDVKAEKMIAEGIQNGSWVFLQNCHLYVSWMDKLEVLVEEINPDTCHKNFRLWLTSMPSLAFPVAILQNGVKMTLEPPAGLRANLKNAYFKLDDDKLNVTSKPGVFKKLLFALCFFHASVQDRRKYGALGWNCPYQFNDTDLEISKSQVERFLDAYEYTPFKVLHFLTSYVNYGGRVTDYIDLRTIHVLLLDLFNPKVLEDDYKFSASGIYRSIAFDEDAPHKSYVDYIESLPLTSDPEAFGLHQNADIICAETETTEAFDTILSLQPKAVAGDGLSREDIISDICKGIEDRLYPPFDTEAVSMAYPLTYNQCMNTVLLQECMRYNGLLKEMARTLPLLRKALKGLVTMSQDLEAMGDKLFVGGIPENWEANAYPSLKPLGPWVDELMERLAFLHDWIDNGVPACYWVPGFYFPQAFFTGVQQNYARKYTLAIDTVSFNVRVREELTREDMEKAGTYESPEDGCYIWGLWLEGARWNSEIHSIDDSLPKQLYTRLPMIHMDPQANRPPPEKGIYRLPVYKTLLRRGTLSTTGHSTNFVMWMEVPSNRAEFKNNLNQVDQDTWIRAGVGAFCALRY